MNSDALEPHTNDPVRPGRAGRVLALVLAFIGLWFLFLTLGVSGVLESGLALVGLPLAVTFLVLFFFVSRLRWPEAATWEVALVAGALTIFWAGCAGMALLPFQLMFQRFR